MNFQFNYTEEFPSPFLNKSRVIDWQSLAVQRGTQRKIMNEMQSIKNWIKKNNNNNYIRTKTIISFPYFPNWFCQDTIYLFPPCHEV